MEFGVDTIFKRLRSVLLAKPLYFDIAHVIDPWQEKWVGSIDRDKAIKQHQQIEDALNSSEVKCNFIEPLKGKVDQVFTRDLGVITEQGAVIGCLKEDIRKGEEIAFMNFCRQNDIPILNKEGLEFEGGDLFIVDSSTGLLGIGPRTNTNAEAVKQIINRGIQLVSHNSPHHLDAIFNIVSKDLVVCEEQHLNSFPYLKDKNVISFSDPRCESLYSNFLLIKENQILADLGCRKFNKKLESEDVDVIEVDVSELKKGGGSLRCMTQPLLRS